MTTGVSAVDRVATIRAAIASDARPRDIARPGHIFPLCPYPEGYWADAGIRKVPLIWRDWGL